MQDLTPSAPAPERYRWVVLAVGAAGAGAFSALRMGLPALGPAIRHEYGLTLSQVGFALTAVGVGVMLTLVPWGMLTDRIGERSVMAVGLAGTAAALTGAALAPGYETLLAGLLLAGMLGASATGASGRAVMGWFARTERGFALGVRQMALPLGGALASLTLPLLAGAGGLRAALLSLAGLSATAALAAAVWLREPPARPLIPPATPLRAPTRDPRIWRLGAASALLVAAQAPLVAFLVLYLHDARGLTPAAAAGCLAGIQLTAAATRIVAGRRSDRRGSRIPPMRRLALANAVLIGAVAALLHAPAVVLYPLLFGGAVSAMTWNGLAFTAAAEISGRARAGTAMSIQNTVVTVGSAIAVSGFGLLVGAAGWQAGYAACALAPLLAFVVLGPLVGEERDRLAASARERARRRRGCDGVAARRPRPAAPREPVHEMSQPLARAGQGSSDVRQVLHDRDGDAQILVGPLDRGGGTVDVCGDVREVRGQLLERATHLGQLRERLLEAGRAFLRARQPLHRGRGLVAGRHRRRLRELPERFRRALQTLRHGGQAVQPVVDEVLDGAGHPWHRAQPVDDRRNHREREQDQALQAATIPRAGSAVRHIAPPQGERRRKTSVSDRSDRKEHR